MRYLIALFVPWLAFFTMGKLISGFLCLFLQITIIGWLPATIWAFISITGHEARQMGRLVSAIERGVSNR